MLKDYEFEISEQTLESILVLKNQMGCNEKTWDDWFSQIIALLKKTKKEQSVLENAFEKNHYKKNYENWVSYFALNLENIAKEYSARELDPTNKAGNELLNSSAIVIGAGPSVKKKKHLELLASSNYEGAIICTDRMLEPVLKAGITPDKFPKFYVATIDPLELLKKFYEDPIIAKFGNKINGIFSSVVHPNIVANARKAGIKIHWIHSLFDYNEGKKSFNQISGLMVRAKNHKDGLPAIQTGGNVGTACWFIAWKILKCNVIGLIGMNHGWDDDDQTLIEIAMNLKNCILEFIILILIVMEFKIQHINTIVMQQKNLSKDLQRILKQLMLQKVEVYSEKEFCLQLSKTFLKSIKNNYCTKKAS